MSIPKDKGRMVRRTVTPEIRESVRNAISLVQRKAAGVLGKRPESITSTDKLLAQASQDGFPQGKGWMHVLLDRYEANDVKFFMALGRACRKKPFAPGFGWRTQPVRPGPGVARTHERPWPPTPTAFATDER